MLIDNSNKFNDTIQGREFHGAVFVDGAELIFPVYIKKHVMLAIVGFDKNKLNYIILFNSDSADDREDNLLAISFCIQLVLARSPNCDISNFFDVNSGFLKDASYKYRFNKVDNTGDCLWWTTGIFCHMSSIYREIDDLYVNTQITQSTIMKHLK